MLEGAPALPTPPDRSPASSLPEHGRFDTDAVDIHDPGFAERINADWWRMATEFWVPEFTMVSTDSRMSIHTTLWGNRSVSTIVMRPDRLDAPVS